LQTNRPASGAFTAGKHVPPAGQGIATSGSQSTSSPLLHAVLHSADTDALLVTSTQHFSGVLQSTASSHWR
jgi:hypothetical protein